MSATMLVKTGDLVDVCDVQGRWLAAEVIGVSTSRDVRVHFLGHVCDNDETIPMSQVATRIVHLYTHTPDRRDWEVHDSVDYQCSVEYGVWMPVQIVAIDSAKSRVQINPNKKIFEETLRTRGAPTSAAKNTKVVWVNMCSDHIAPLGSHTTSNSSNKNKRARHDIAGNYTQTAVFSPALLPPPISPTWLAPLLRARQVSEDHIVHCEQALVRDEGFTTSALFAAVPAYELTGYLRDLGIAARGVQLNVVEAHKALQPQTSGGAKFAIKVA